MVRAVSFHPSLLLFRMTHYEIKMDLQRVLGICSGGNRQTVVTRTEFLSLEKLSLLMRCARTKRKYEKESSSIVV